MYTDDVRGVPRKKWGDTLKNTHHEPIPIEWMMLAEFARKHKKSEAHIRHLCAAGRIYGAFKMADVWLIPVSAEYPEELKRGPHGKH